MQIGLRDDINSSEPGSDSNIPFSDIRDRISHTNLLLYKNTYESKHGLHF